MSYLNLPSLNLADIQKGTISLWFRFSDDSVTKAAAYQSEKFHPAAPAVLDSTMPLITFGRKVMANVYDSKEMTWTQEAGGATLTHSVPQVDYVGDGPCAPSHIGIFCGGDNPQLVMQFQMETRAYVAGLVGQVNDVYWSLDPAGGGYNMHRTIDDVSYVRVGEPESFRIVPKFKVEVDKWHHLLMSFDFSSNVDVVAAELPMGVSFGSEEELRSATIGSHCKLWFAFDDENKNGKDNIGNNQSVFQSASGWVPGDENGIITQNAEGAIFSYSIFPPVTDSAGSPLDINNMPASPEYHWSSSLLPMQDSPVGLPASTEYVETISHCEMAEFQFFGGLVIDTGNAQKRRMFVDQDGKPVPPEEAEKLLGRRPDILLHRTSNWQDGRNTGTTGIEISTDGEEHLLPSGQFTPTAKIEKYTPDPALDKTETPTA